MKTAREEVISRKYALSASQYKAKKLQKELLSAVSANNEP
jgi:hypothetical protein